MTPSVPAVLVATVATVAASQTVLNASITVTDSRTAYEALAEAESIDLFDQTFSSYSGTETSFSGGEGDWAWTITSDNGVEADGSLIKAVSGGSALVIEFASSNVFSIGADFFLLEDGGDPIPGLVQLMLSDGTSYVAEVGTENNFAGFVSQGEAIMSMSLYGFETHTPETTALSAVSIGVIPGPASFTGLIAVSSLVRRRRR